jgi:hypothetical protein
MKLCHRDGGSWPASGPDEFSASLLITLYASTRPRARLPRLIIPGIPYHVTQRGNRREQTFFDDAEHAFYRDLLAQSAANAGAEI